MLVHACRGSVLFLTLGLAGCFGDGPIGPSNLDNNNNGPSTPPQLQVGVSLIDFGDVTYGQSYTEQLHVENVGGKDLVLSGITATAPFTANYASTITITGGGSTTLVVRYQPTEYAVHDGTFSFWWNQEETDTTADAKEDDTGGSVQATAYFELPLYGAVISDVDGDGHDCEAAGGDDCDDEDDGSYPGAAEIWYDGDDQDCLGDDDYDQDGDGFQIDYWNSNVESGGGDCNDANPEVYPGAKDEWYDNVDSDCDGADDWDQDGDGYRTTLGDRGNDCDDLNAAISPGATEDPENGIDDDCDGRVDES
jgi:hypothetical protein